MFNRTKNAIAKGREIKAQVQNAPKAAGSAIAGGAKSLGVRAVNGSNHCKSSPTRKHQTTEARPLRELATWTEPDTGIKYYLVQCRHCDGVMKAIPTGKKN